MGAAGYPEPPFTRVCLNFNHLDIQTNRGRHHLATIKRVMVTPAVCPRWIEILSTLTFGAPRKNHIVSTAFETRRKKHRDRQG